MTAFNLTLLVGGAVACFTIAPITTTHAQDTTPTVTQDHGDWTLKQREDWLNRRIDASRDNGALDHVEYDRVRHELGNIRHEEDAMRDSQHGQLTDNQTTDLEARLDNVATRIHWANATNFARPWDH